MSLRLWQNESGTGSGTETGGRETETGSEIETLGRATERLDVPLITTNRTQTPRPSRLIIRTTRTGRSGTAGRIEETTRPRGSMEGTETTTTHTTTTGGGGTAGTGRGGITQTAPTHDTEDTPTPPIAPPTACLLRPPHTEHTIRLKSCRLMTLRLRPVWSRLPPSGQETGQAQVAITIIDPTMHRYTPRLHLHRLLFLLPPSSRRRWLKL